MNDYILFKLTTCASTMRNQEVKFNTEECREILESLKSEGS